jgi:hypothetical protein
LTYAHAAVTDHNVGASSNSSNSVIKSKSAASELTDWEKQSPVIWDGGDDDVDEDMSHSSTAASPTAALVPAPLLASASLAAPSLLSQASRNRHLQPVDSASGDSFFVDLLLMCILQELNTLTMMMMMAALITSICIRILREVVWQPLWVLTTPLRNRLRREQPRILSVFSEF